MTNPSRTDHGPCPVCGYIGSDADELPTSLFKEVERQRATEISNLERRIEKLRALPPSEWEFYFNEEHTSASLRLAISTTVRLDRSGGCTVRNLERVVFKPDPCKAAGAWLVRVSFTRDGSCAGRGWYVTRAELSRAWEDSVREAER